MNAHEKYVLGLTVSEIAKLANDEINQKIEVAKNNCCIKDYLEPWTVGRIICDVLNEYIPRETLRALGLAAAISCSDYYSNTAVPQNCILKINLRRRHPYYSKFFTPQMMSTCWTLFDIKRKKQKCVSYGNKTVLVFEKLLPVFNAHQTILEICKDNAKYILAGQTSCRNAARTMLEIREEIGGERLKQLLDAAARLKNLPDIAYSGGIIYADKSSEDYLKDVAGEGQRTQAIMAAVKDGRHPVPAGVVLKDGGGEH